MSPWSADDMRMVALKAAADVGTTAEVTIPVRGGAGVNLSAIGWALGLEPSTVRLNGYFVSRGNDFVSSLSWDSLLSFFAARGLSSGASLLDSILVQGKHIAHAGYVGRPNFKRKATENNERPCKKNQMFEVCSTEKSVSTEQVLDDVFLSIKRRLMLADDPPSKKEKVGESNLDWQSSKIKNAGHLCYKRKCTTEVEKNQENNILLECSSIEQNFDTGQENNAFFCMKKRLKLDDDHPFKKGEIDELKSGLCNEASKLSMVFTKIR